MNARDQAMECRVREEHEQQFVFFADNAAENHDGMVRLKANHPATLQAGAQLQMLRVDHIDSKLSGDFSHKIPQRPSDTM